LTEMSTKPAKHSANSLKNNFNFVKIRIFLKDSVLIFPKVKLVLFILLMQIYTDLGDN